MSTNTTKFSKKTRKKKVCHGISFIIIDDMETQRVHIFFLLDVCVLVARGHIHLSSFFIFSLFFDVLELLRFMHLRSFHFFLFYSPPLSVIGVSASVLFTSKTQKQTFSQYPPPPPPPPSTTLIFFPQIVSQCSADFFIFVVFFWAKKPEASLTIKSKGKQSKKKKHPFPISPPLLRLIDKKKEGNTHPSLTLDSHISSPLTHYLQVALFPPSFFPFSPSPQILTSINKKKSVFFYGVEASLLWKLH